MLQDRHNEAENDNLFIMNACVEPLVPSLEQANARCTVMWRKLKKLELAVNSFTASISCRLKDAHLMNTAYMNGKLVNL